MIQNVNAMITHQQWMDVNAHNIANVNTENFRALEVSLPSSETIAVSQSESGTDLARSLSEQIVIEKGFAAQAPAIKTYDAMLGTLLDLKA